MKPDKQTKSETVVPELIRVIAAKGHVLPIRYRKSIVRIDEREPKEFLLKELSYEGIHQLRDALKNKQIFEAGEL